MESCALTFSRSTTLNHINRNTILRIIPVYSSSSSPSNINYKASNSNNSVISFRSYSIFNNSSLFFQNLVRYDLGVVRAAASSTPETSDESTNPAAIGRTLQLAAMFGVWYLLNIYFNIFNKQVLKVFPYPTTLTTFQFGCGSLMVFIMWTLKLHPKPKLYKSQIVPILMLAAAHTTGNLLTNISLGKVAVSFTHTIKAMEPFFTVLFSVLLLSEIPTLWVVLSLAPIVGGVALASFTEASFNWIGFGSAMASNVTNQSRNVLSKKFMVRKEEALDNINLFSVMTVISFFLLIPFALLLEGFKFTPEYLKFAASQGVNVRDLCVRSVLTGICFHSYQQQATLVLNASRRFRYTLDLKKEEEKKEIIAKIRTHSEVIRAAGEKTDGTPNAPPFPFPTGGYDVSPAQLAKMTSDHDFAALQNFGGVKGLAEKLKTNPDKGIHEDKSNILDRKNVFRSNTYPRKKGRSFWMFLLDACHDTTLIILMVAAAASLALGIKSEVNKDHRLPFLMSGCKVADGYGTMLATSVGINTEWGLLMASISEDNGEETPLQKNGRESTKNGGDVTKNGGDVTKNGGIF